MNVQRGSFLLLILVLLLLGVGLQNGVPEASAAAPTCLTTGGCVGFPDADAVSGRFVNVTRGLSSLGDVGATDNVFNIELQVPGAGTPTEAGFELAVFDGDLSKPWDVVPRGTPDPIVFKLFPDPLIQGNTTGTPLYEWPAKFMVNDGWCVLDPAYPGDPDPNVCTDGVEIPHDVGALATDGNYYYHLVADWETTLNTKEQNNFKVVVEGIPFILPQSTIGLMGYVPGDPLGGTSTYSGQWSFQFLVPNESTEIELWDGDADRSDDSDDFNSPSFPTWTPYSSSTQAQGLHIGVPADDISGPLGIPPNVYYNISPPSDSGETWMVSNGPPGDLEWQPSGDKEWEVFKIGLDSGPAPNPADEATPDVTVPRLPPGLYEWEFIGLDGRNTMFIYSEYATFPGKASLGNTVWYDANEDGVWAQDASEPGIEGVLINLYLDEGVIGTYEPGTDSYLSSQTTDVNGVYLFADLDALDYFVIVDSSNFGSGQPLENHTQTATHISTDDHHNRPSPWSASIPANLNYALADFGYVVEDEADLEVTKTYEIVCEPECPCGCDNSADGVRDIDCHDPPEEECYIEFTITATNLGPGGPVLGVVVEDLLPVELTYVDHTTSTGDYDPNSGVWDGFNLAAGVSETLTIRVETLSNNGVNNFAESPPLSTHGFTPDQFSSEESSNKVTVERNGKGIECHDPPECEYECGEITNTAIIYSTNAVFVDPDLTNNEASVSLPYGNCSVVMILELKAEVKELVVQGEIPARKAGRLIKYLDYAVKYLRECNTRYAIYKMYHFIRYVNYYEKYGAISEEVADHLRTQAYLIIAEIRAG